VPDPVRNASNAPEGAPGQDPLSDKPPWVQQHSQDRSNEYLGSDGDPDGADVRRKSLRTLKSVDDMVDRLLTRLRDTHQLDDTLAFFTSDNGYLWNDHGLIQKPHAYYENIRVPLFMRWPGQVTRRSDSTLVANIDLPATAMAAARIKPDSEIDGQDLLAANRSPRQRLLVEKMSNGGFGPLWASLITAAPSGIAHTQYTEYYDAWPTGDVVVDPDNWSEWTLPPGPHLPEDTGLDPVREFYDLVLDRMQLTNKLHDGAGNEPANLVTLAEQLTDARQCRGNSAASSNPCP
jgi:arylsulfatase A-like enzyme